MPGFMPVSPTPTERAARTLLVTARWVRRFKPSDLRTAQWFASAIGAALLLVMSWIFGTPAETLLRFAALVLAVALVAYLLLRYTVRDSRLLRFLSRRFWRVVKDRHLNTLLSASSPKPLDDYLRAEYPTWHVEGIAEVLFAEKRVYRGRRRPPG